MAPGRLRQAVSPLLGLCQALLHEAPLALGVVSPAARGRLGAPRLVQFARPCFRRLPGGLDLGRQLRDALLHRRHGRLLATRRLRRLQLRGGLGRGRGRFGHGEAVAQLGGGLGRSRLGAAPRLRHRGLGGLGALLGLRRLTAECLELLRCRSRLLPPSSHLGNLLLRELPHGLGAFRGRSFGLGQPALRGLLGAAGLGLGESRLGQLFGGSLRLAPRDGRLLHR
mmetsp:Transcript_84478/g.244211  ORF Transcript_84478/g.244211 Transcript_84478/m.244211 type:complete len:225 (-) Transcript_84478:2528-3202(-)